MAELLLELFRDALHDSVKLLPFLFVTYLFMELLEHRAGGTFVKKIGTVDKAGPLWGAAFGVVPQCGFSAAASSLFAGRVISVGTLLAIYLSTSDEMLPIFLSAAVPLATIGRILAAKLVLAAVSGFLVELCLHRLMHRMEDAMDIHTVCEEEHCHCEDGAFVSACKHTLRIFVYIVLISFALNLAISLVGEHTLAALLSDMPLIGHVLAALVGLIPNCAASVVITSLYLDGIISAGVMMSGLFANAGVGLLVLFRLNKNSRQNFVIVCLLYGFAVCWGFLISLLGLQF
jgi:hypothetical protein